MARKITAIKVQKRNPERVNIYLDGEFAFGLARIVAAWLTIGQELSDQELSDLQGQDVYEKAYQKGLNYLSYRMRSESEMRRKLVENDFPEDVIEQTLSRMRQSGLLDDTRFAQAWVDSRIAFHPRGRRVLAIELRQKGVEDEIIQETLAENVQEDDIAYQAIQRKAARMADQEWNEFRSRLIQFLARRGFNYETCIQAVRRAWDDTRPQNEVDNYLDTDESDIEE